MHPFDTSTQNQPSRLYYHSLQELILILCCDFALTVPLYIACKLQSPSTMMEAGGINPFCYMCVELNRSRCWPASTTFFDPLIKQPQK